MKLNVQTRPQMVYQLSAVKRDADGVEVSRRESGEIPNVFTDYGIENLYGAPGTHGNTTQFGAVVGTGNATPTTSDTLLQAFLAGKGPSSAGSRSFVNNGDGTGYVQTPFTFVFAVGAATGNISEVGAANSGGSPTSTSPLLSSRALVVDGLGNPTTFEVLSDEELELTLFFRQHVNYQDRVTVINVNGVDYTVTLRPLALGNPNSFWGFPGSFGLNNSSRILYGTGVTLADPVGTGSPVGTGTGAGGDNLAQGSQGSVLAYVPGSKQRECYMRRPTGAAQNISGLYTMMSHGSWQVGFSPSIPKSAVERFTMNLMYSMDNTP